MVTSDYLENMNIDEVGFYDLGDNNFLESDFFLINLNTNFLNYIGTEWVNKISNFKGCSKSFDYYHFDSITGYRVLPNDTLCTGLSFSDYKIELLDISDYAFQFRKIIGIMMYLMMILAIDIIMIPKMIIGYI